MFFLKDNIVFESLLFSLIFLYFCRKYEYNEENYIFQKLFRAAIGTNNVDHCARLCHASTVSGLATTLGSGAMTNSIEEVLNNEVIFFVDSSETLLASCKGEASKKPAVIINITKVFNPSFKETIFSSSFRTLC